MVIAISAGGPDLDAPFDPDFGRCPFFCVLDTQDARCSSWNNPCAGLRADAAGKVVDLLAGLGVTQVLTGICQETARRALARAGIDVSPCQAGTVRQAVAACACPPGATAQGPSAISHDEALASLGFPIVSPVDVSFSPRCGGRGMGGGGRGMGGGGRGMGGGGRGMGGGGRGMGGGGGRGLSGAGRNAVPRPASPAPAPNRPMTATTPPTKGVPGPTKRRRQKAVIDSALCTGCGACLDDCPTGALSLQDGKASADLTLCVGCGACLRACPAGAVSLLRDPPA